MRTYTRARLAALLSFHPRCKDRSFYLAPLPAPPPNTHTSTRRTRQSARPRAQQKPTGADISAQNAQCNLDHISHHIVHVHKESVSLRWCTLDPRTSVNLQEREQLREARRETHPQARPSWCRRQHQRQNPRLRAHTHRRRCRRHHAAPCPEI